MADYVRYRPGYPREVLDLLVRECGLTRDAVVADVGSGTGLLSQLLVEAGYRVIGVEPNADMRLASPYAAVDGSAEATGLGDRSVDLIVTGQAFHWFDVAATKVEWGRILKAGGSVALVWNDRVREGVFMSQLEALIDRFAMERDADGAIRERGRGRVGEFFAPLVAAVAEFGNEQLLDFEGLRGRVFSCSYMPVRSNELTDELQVLYGRFAQGGLVKVVYKTSVYYAKSGQAEAPAPH